MKIVDEYDELLYVARKRRNPTPERCSECGRFNAKPPQPKLVK